MKHHSLDVHPKPKEKTPLYVNEPELLDLSYHNLESLPDDTETESDNIRIYVPLDLNAEAILRRLRIVIARYHEASEKNESDFSLDVHMLTEQIEIYDQIWFARGSQHKYDSDREFHGHSEEAVALVERFVAELEEIPDACAECFPFDLIAELKQEYLGVPGLAV